MSEMSLSELRAAVVTAAHRLAEAGLVPGTSGNLSARVGDRIAVTATGAALAGITAEQVTVVDLSGAVVAGELAPTSELGLHLAIYRHTPAGAIVHHHAPFSTTVSLVTDELPVVHYQQLAFGGSARVAPFAVFGTPELTANVLAALDGRRAALMANHGAVAWGRELADALENALLLEWACELYWRARAIGAPRTLSAEQQDAVLTQIRLLHYGAPRPRG